MAIPPHALAPPPRLNEYSPFNHCFCLPRTDALVQLSAAQPERHHLFSYGDVNCEFLARCWERGLQGNLALAPATKDAACLLAPLEPRAVSGWMALGLGTNLSPARAGPVASASTTGRLHVPQKSLSASLQSDFLEFSQVGLGCWGSPPSRTPATNSSPAVPAPRPPADTEQGGAGTCSDRSALPSAALRYPWRSPARCAIQEAGGRVAPPEHSAAAWHPCQRDPQAGSWTSSVPV